MLDFNIFPEQLLDENSFGEFNFSKLIYLDHALDRASNDNMVRLLSNSKSEGNNSTSAHSCPALK